MRVVVQGCLTGDCCVYVGAGQSAATVQGSGDLEVMCVSFRTKWIGEFKGPA